MNSASPCDDGPSEDDRIDELCDSFESAWHGGQRPKIRDIVGAGREVYHRKLFRELLLVELECRRSAGEQPSQAEYLREFPQYASQIDSVALQYGAAAFSTPAASTSGDQGGDVKRVGGRIAQFELVERLGSGAMGEAWKAWDSRLKRNVTIKLPHSHLLGESELRRFLREAEAAAQLSHPQLACVHEAGSVGGTLYIVATFVEGNNLRNHASQRKLEIGEIVELCASAAEALQHAHDQGVVHRDLKPSNIIVGPSGVPHIIDFGLAKFQNAEHDLTLHGEVLGTPAYMSPELAGGDGANVGPKSDVYSLGVILYELLTGRPPFEGGRGSVITQIVACIPPTPRSLSRSIPRDLETICLKAMERSLTNRYATAGAVAEDLRRFAAGRPIRARRVGIVEKSWRAVRRHPVMALSTLALLGAVLLAAVMISSLQTRNKRLAGVRPVYITTTPSGAKVAIIPLDPKTNEPDQDPKSVTRPGKLTPLTTDLKAATYLVEASITDAKGTSFVEVYRTVPDLSKTSTLSEQANRELGVDPDTSRFGDIQIAPLRNVIDRMVKVEISESARQRNPLLPVALYVDATQTKPDDLKSIERSKDFLSYARDGTASISYPGALKWAEKNQVRLLSADEYDAIVDAVKKGNARFVGTGKVASMGDLFDDVPELCTTIKMTSMIGGNGVSKHLQGRQILKGYATGGESPGLLRWVDGTLLADPFELSPIISIRGVKSGTPRFLKP